MNVTLIAAVSEDGFISRGKGVPWDLPADRVHFRAHTAGKWLLIGRKTYQEMLGWFKPGHHPLVLTRDEQFTPSVGQRVSSAVEAIALAQDAGVQELMVCGGAECYAAAMPHATKLLLTRVHTKLGQGSPFPEVSGADWQEISHRELAADAENRFSMTFSTYERTKT